MFAFATITSPVPRAVFVSFFDYFCSFRLLVRLLLVNQPLGDKRGKTTACPVGLNFSERGKTIRPGQAGRIIYHDDSLSCLWYTKRALQKTP
jgi:hypothetical protein